MTDLAPKSAPDDLLTINHDTKATQAFRQLLIERGYPSINEFIVDVLREEASKKREARLRDIGSRMFPGGKTAPHDGGVA